MPAWYTIMVKKIIEFALGYDSNFLLQYSIVCWSILVVPTKEGISLKNATWVVT
jgi:hypothetical protein